MLSTAVITVGGDVTTVLALARFADHLPNPVVGPTTASAGHAAPEVRVIAADQGWVLARRLDLDVDVLIGDLDSISAAELAAATEADVDVRRHATDKDATDLDLALDLALAGGARRIVVVDGGGDRFDHQLANVLVAAGAARHAEVTVVSTQGVVSVVTDTRELRGSVGDVVTLLPIFGRVDGIVTTGLLYPLSDEALVGGSSRGVSNELVAPEARVRIETGTLLAVQPGR